MGRTDSPVSNKLLGHKVNSPLSCEAHLNITLSFNAPKTHSVEVVEDNYSDHPALTSLEVPDIQKACFYFLFYRTHTIDTLKIGGCVWAALVHSDPQTAGTSESG